MKPLLLILLNLALIQTGLLADIKPDASNTPLFHVCALVQQPDKSAHNYVANTKKPLLTVVSLHDLRAGADGLSLRVILNGSDAKALAKLSRHAQLFALVGPGVKDGDKEVMVIIDASQPIENGSLEFSNSRYTGPMAAYLRQRFHFKPGSNDVEQAPVKLPETTP